MRYRPGPKRTRRPGSLGASPAARAVGKRRPGMRVIRRVILQLVLLGIVLLVGVSGITCQSGKRNAERRQAFNDASSKYRIALSDYNSMVPPGPGPVSYAEMSVHAQRQHQPDVWSWANHTALVARELASTSLRLAASAEALDREPYEASMLRDDAEALAANAAIIAHSVAVAPSASTPARGDDSDVVMPPQMATPRLSYFVGLAREQRRLGYALYTMEVRYAGASARIDPSPFASLWQAIVGEFASAIWTTLLISAAVALIVLAVASLIVGVLRRYGIKGQTKLELFKLPETAPLMLAILVPLVALPYLILIPAPGATDTPAESLTGVVHESNPGTSPVQSVTVGLMGPDITVEDPAEARATRREIFDALNRQLAALEEQQRETRVDMRTTATLADRLEQRFRDDSVTVAAQFAKSDADRATAHARDTLLANQLTSSRDHLATVTQRLLEEERNVRPSMNTLMGVTWLAECLRLREDHRALPVRAWRSLVGSDDKADVMRAVRAANGDATVAAQRVCSDSSIVEARPTPAALVSQAPR